HSRRRLLSLGFVSAVASRAERLGRRRRPALLDHVGRFVSHHAHVGRTLAAPEENIAAEGYRARRQAVGHVVSAGVSVYANFLQVRTEALFEWLANLGRERTAARRCGRA